MRIRLLLILLAVCSISPPAIAEEEKFVPLFDGTSLNGWVSRGGTARYEVRDNMLVGTSIPKERNSFLCTTASYENFILELEFKIDPRLNSGVQVRSQSKPDYKEGRVFGYQVEIDPSERSWTGGIYDESRRGWLYKLEDNQAARDAFKTDDWNHLRIVCSGDSIKTFINGVAAADLKDGLDTRGFVALQVHATEEDEPLQVFWRNIRICELPPTAKPPAEQL